MIKKKKKKMEDQIPYTHIFSISTTNGVIIKPQSKPNPSSFPLIIIFCSSIKPRPLPFLFSTSQLTKCSDYCTVVSDRGGRFLSTPPPGRFS